jgi:DNA-binding transcriptional regulator YiaG
MNIKEEREKHIISQSDLANMLGCTQDLVSKWETGKHRPSNKYLRKMVDVFARLESGISVLQIIATK